MRMQSRRKLAVRATAADCCDSVRTYFSEWIAFYQDFYKFPPDIPVTFEYGFDSDKATYCTTDALLPGQVQPQPTVATGLVSVLHKSGPLATVAYQRGTAVSFYDTPSNPDIVGALEPRGESFEGPREST